ncbi:Hypothetical protein SRAE_2000197100 [Strongyloides ratti]|uniref:Uncharacterized protein n=1 Tax=Strongyloides ratti TaxID=34506 RepID=A0A090LC21_STRRB|nr:Hypothetical protein SRAE_2000197100 [Strongyloides ratti]CEF67307.1 Hypothetical protein SRAE_2000197100 [Strongyloides ratti]
MRDGNDISDTIVDNIIYIGINAILVCGIIAFLSCGFAIITILCNIMAGVLVTISQRLTKWIRRNKTYPSICEPKNITVLSPTSGEVPRDDPKSSFNRTPLNLESIRFDSSSDMEYFSLDGDGFDENETLNVLPCEYKSINFFNGVKCHSTPNGTNQYNDSTLPFTYAKKPAYIL